jgi:hypothetical protein
MGKLFEKAHHDETQRSYESRQRALEQLQDTCVKNNVCAACGASAGMYLAALASKAIGYDKQRFLDLAAEVWDDLARQEKSGDKN